MNTLNIRQDFLIDLKMARFTPRMKQVLKGKNYIAFVNVARGLKGLYTTFLDELNEFDIDIEQFWVHSTPRISMQGGSVSMERIDVFFNEPIISCDCVHVIFMTSKDAHLLEYAEYIFNRYMKSYKSISKVDDDRKINTDSIELCQQARLAMEHLEPHKVQVSPVGRNSRKKKPTFIDKVIKKIIQLLIDLSREK